MEINPNPQTRNYKRRLAIQIAIALISGVLVSLCYLTIVRLVFIDEIIRSGNAYSGLIQVVSIISAVVFLALNLFISKIANKKFITSAIAYFITTLVLNIFTFISFWSIHINY